jgi:hypothetical protein
MAYETKTLLVSIANIIEKASSLEEAYNTVAEIANVEGVILRRFGAKRDEPKGEAKNKK